MKKICKDCRQELSENSFPLNRGKYRLHTCRSCLSKKSTAWTIKARKIKFSRAWFTRRFFRLKRNAKDRGKKFDLTIEEFCKIRTYKNEHCFYCGTSQDPFSIERVDNAKGYSVQNCVVACWRCNKMKSRDYTAVEMQILGEALRKIDHMRGV